MAPALGAPPKYYSAAEVERVIGSKEVLLAISFGSLFHCVKFYCYKS